VLDEEDGVALIRQAAQDAEKLLDVLDRKSVV